MTTIKEVAERTMQSCGPHEKLQDAYLRFATRFLAEWSKTQEPVASARLHDAQWVNIVNHDNVWRDWSKEDAVNEAVKMTEAKCVENSADLIERLAAERDELLGPNPVEQMLREQLAAMTQELDEWRHGERQYPPATQDYKELCAELKQVQVDLRVAAENFCGAIADHLRRKADELEGKK